MQFSNNSEENKLPLSAFQGEAQARTVDTCLPQVQAHTTQSQVFQATSSIKIYEQVQSLEHIAQTHFSQIEEMMHTCPFEATLDAFYVFSDRMQTVANQLCETVKRFIAGEVF